MEAVGGPLIVPPSLRFRSSSDGPDGRNIFLETAPPRTLRATTGDGERLPPAATADMARCGANTCTHFCSLLLSGLLGRPARHPIVYIVILPKLWGKDVRCFGVVRWGTCTHLVDHLPYGSAQTHREPRPSQTASFALEHFELKLVGFCRKHALSFLKRRAAVMACRRFFYDLISGARLVARRHADSHDTQV